MNPWSRRRTPNVEAHACQVDRWPAEREGPRSELGTSKTGCFLKEFAKNWGKKQQKNKTKKQKTKKQQNKQTKKTQQNKWALSRVIPWEMGPHFPEKQRLGLGLGGCAKNTNPFLKIYVPIQVLMQGQKPKPNWNSFLHILHVRQIQEPECMKTRQPRLHILHAP